MIVSERPCKDFSHSDPGSYPDNNLLPVKKYNFLNAYNTGTNLPDFFNQGDAQAFRTATPKRILRVHGDVHDRNLLRGGPQENHHAHGIVMKPVPIVGK